MPITVPAAGQEVSASTFGAPVANALNLIESTPWIVLPLSNGWVPSATPQYRKVGDMVQIRGAIQGGTIAGNTVLGTLPAGYRPSVIQYFTQPYYYTGWQNAVISVNGSGQMLISVTALIGAPEPLSLDRMTYSVTA